MNKEEKHIAICSAIKAQILGIAAMLDQEDDKREIIYCEGGFSYAAAHLYNAAAHLDLMMECLEQEEEIDEEEFMREVRDEEGNVIGIDGTRK